VAAIEEESKAGLHRLAQGLKAQGISSVESIRVGSVPGEILRGAAEAHADLLVMGTHGRTGLARMLLGSVAEQVAKRAETQVVLVR